MPVRSVYLDYAAATPLDGRVAKAMQPYFSTNFYNPSASYQASRKVKDAIESARSDVANVLGAKSSEIIFTAGGTEANNLAVQGIMNEHKKSNIIISAIEHPSLYEPAKNYNHKVCPVDKTGMVDFKKLKKLIDDQTVLISVMYVNNEIGVIEPISEAAKLVKEIRQSRFEKGLNLPIYLHTDACQAANYLDLHTSRLGVDLMTINGGKIYGPKQSGALFIKSDVLLQPLIFGGGQERGFRNGTENVPAIIGFAKALSLAQASRKTNSDKLASLQSDFIKQLLQTFGNATINGSLTKRIANNVHVTFNGVDNERLLYLLDEQGIMAAAGSACSAASVEPSTVLRAIGLSDELAQNSIRFTLGNDTSLEELKYVVKTLQKVMS